MARLLFALFTFTALQPASAAERAVHPALAGQPALAGGMAAALAFAEDFAAKHGRPLGQEFVGLDAAQDGATGLYAIPAAGQLAKDAYSCRFRQDGKGLIVTADCAAAGTSETFAYAPGTRVLPLAKFEEAAVEALELFAKKFGAATRVEKARLWQTGGNVELALTFTPAGQPAKTVYMMCHQHGAHFDCHTQSRPGPKQPAK